MGKVISLKLTAKEERIITRLNQAGISYSELIRDALWHYFRTVDKKINQVNQLVNPVDQKVNQVNQKVNYPPKQIYENTLYDYIFCLKNETKELREENNKLQKNLQYEIENIHKLYSKSSCLINQSKIEQTIEGENDFSDVHDAIDEFLKKRL